MSQDHQQAEQAQLTEDSHSAAKLLQAQNQDFFESSSSLFETSDQLGSCHQQNELELAKISGLQNRVNENEHQLLKFDDFLHNDNHQHFFIINLLITLQEAIRRGFYFEYTENDLYVSKNCERDGYYVIIKHNNKVNSTIESLTKTTRQIYEKWFKNKYPLQEQITIEQMLTQALVRIFFTLKPEDQKKISLRDLITRGIITLRNTYWREGSPTGKGSFQARIFDDQKPDSLVYTIKKLESTTDDQTGVMSFIYLMELIGQRPEKQSSVQSPLYEYIRFGDEVIMFSKEYASNLLDLKLAIDDHFEEKNIKIFLQILEFLSALISNNCIPFDLNPDMIKFSECKFDETKVFIIIDIFCLRFSNLGLQMQQEQTHKKAQVAATSYNSTSHYEADPQDNIHQLGVTFMVFLLQRYRVSDTPSKSILIQELREQKMISNELKDLVISMVRDEKQNRPTIKDVKQRLNTLGQNKSKS